MTTLGTAVVGQGQEAGILGTHRLFAAGPHADLAQHALTFGPLPLEWIGSSFMAEFEASGLTGRGGAAFSSWRKMAATHQAGIGLAVGPVVVANGAEGEPLSFKDKTLLAHAPHLVLDGLLAAARAVRASQLYVYATPNALRAVETAVAARHDARGIRVVPAPETFIAGQASAVVNSISNGIALPTDRRLRLSESGIKARATLVFNVETLAHMGLIARYGSAWFRAEGSERDPGTRLVSLSGLCAEQVLEVEGNAGLLGILADAGVHPSEVQAVLVGGYHGRWVRPLDYRLSPAGPAHQVVRPGAGVLHILPKGECGLVVTARMVGYLAEQSARQCGPCMFGLPAMSRVLDAIAYGGRDPGLVQELDRLAKLVGGRGACHHPDGTAQLVVTALDAFSDDVVAHLAGRCTGTEAELP